ncbi:hypothetical protein GH714_000885 [Hevea brasiliensis]|uniref:acid phosphatase n=1 Tax=Hevea brasiliensis TaxID=3981 RepID=A0A6A6N8D3_HEVBR|nr:hypothetical protein GH714_000885 [Hevea brasiliensis]
MASSTDSETKPFSVLFVCLGNICRSPAAEGVFTEIVKKRGLDSKFKIDSAGTIGYHEGNPADPRMRAASKRRGIQITSISRPIRPSDFRDFDIILAMDKQNREDIMEAFNMWKFKETLPDDAHEKVKLMCSYCKKHDETEVPDPYYGGPQGFEKIFASQQASQLSQQSQITEYKLVQEDPAPTQKRQAAGMYDLDPFNMINAKFDALTNVLAKKMEDLSSWLVHHHQLEVHNKWLMQRKLPAVE